MQKVGAFGAQYPVGRWRALGANSSGFTVRAICRAAYLLEVSFEIRVRVSHSRTFGSRPRLEPLVSQRV